MISLPKKITAPLILVMFLVPLFFGALTMAHGSDGRMQGDCPFSSVGNVNCIQDTTTSALHHIFSYQSFFNVSVANELISLFALMFIALSLFFRFYIDKNVSNIFVKNRFYNFPPDNSYLRKMTGWLSLFENSPSAYMNA